MRKPDNNGRLQDILDAINRIESYLRGSDEKKFTNDLMCQDAIVRQIEVIGEAGHNVSSEFQEQHPEIPWAQMLGMRNKIAHDYGEIDIGEIWKTVKRDIPVLKKSVSKLLG